MSAVLQDPIPTHAVATPPADAATARLEQVRCIARDVAGPAAEAVDRDARFPREAMAALAEAGLLWAQAPVALGGGGAGLVELGLACEALGQRCASAGMVFAMHQVQVACLVRHGHSPWFRERLAALVRGQRLIASVTSEAGVGGSVRTSICPIEAQQDGQCRLHKEGTVVSYVEAADDLLITVRRSADSAPGDQALVLVDKAQCQVQVHGSWDTLGMRGTCSPACSLTALFNPAQVVPGPFADINAHTMVPWAHILWASTWLGIATDAVARARAFVRDTGRRLGGTPPTAARLSALSTQLQLMRAQVREWARRAEAMAAQPDGGAAEFSTIACSVQLNQLKIGASELVAEICQQALRLTGTTGYRNDSPYSVTRHLRDAHSAALMIGNERIHAANGALQMVYRDEAL